MEGMTNLSLSQLMSDIQSLSSTAADVTAAEDSSGQEIFMEGLNRLSKIAWSIQVVLHDAEEREIHEQTIRLWLEKVRSVANAARFALFKCIQLRKTKVKGMKAATKAEPSVKTKVEGMKSQVEGMKAEVGKLKAEIEKWKAENEKLNAEIERRKAEAPAKLYPRRKQKLKDVLNEDKVSLPYSTSLKIRHSQTIKEIIKEFDEIARDMVALRLRKEDEPMRFCLDDAMKSPPSVSLMPYCVVGRKDDKEKIIQLLMSNSEKENTVIPIVGLGGVGKTTLAQLVYNDPVVDLHFSPKVWVYVSEEFDVVRITRKIMTSIIGPSSLHDNNNLNDLQCKLNMALSKQRFLLVLDDIWTERQDLWEALSAPFSGVGMGKIIVTTRSKSVAHIMQTVPPHELGCLDEEKSWLLFQRHAFDGWELHQQLNFEQIGREITKKCGGLPLALKGIGRFLRYEVEEQIWKDVLNNDLARYRAKTKLGEAIEPPENTSGVDDAVIYGRKDDEKKLLLSDDCKELDISLIQITGETTSKVGDAVIYGREDDKKKVIQLLLSDDRKELHISLIQITGAGGIGKSTLAYLVYNDSMICDYFDIKAWVHMPEGINDVGGILKAAIESLTGISCYVTELNELVLIIEEELKGKRFLIVLDNVRNEKQGFWGSFMVSLSIGAKGSMVMVTTQTEIISDLMGSIRPYHLNSLSDDHCFSIFLQYAFDKQEPCIFPELVRTGKHIVAKCEGVPLAAKAVGALLHFNENNFPADSQYWKDVLESALWESDDCFPALSLCYDYLPMHLKLCFRYCSLFPEGYIFEKDHLIRLWMSQGYLESTDGEAAEDIGINCFEELLRRSFFQCLDIYDARERKYGIHDLFHKFAKRVVVECFRIENSMLSCIPGNISHLSLVPCAVEALVSNPYKQESDLPRIFFRPRSAPKWQGSAVLNDLFIKFRCLRSLDLSSTDIKELPDSIKNLESLCYLSLNNTNIRSLPDSICNLGSLQTLELQDCYFLSDLTPNIKKLTKLQCLNVSKESGFISMPSGIGELRNLRTLSNFNVGKVGLHCQIVELQSLLHLRGSLCIAGLENVVSGDQANQANLKMNRCLKTLTLHWFQNGWESEAETEENALDVIQYLQPHTNLEELIIHNYFGSQFPPWLGDPLFCNLVSVTLDNCYESNVLPPLGQLPSLRFLSLRKMDSVRTLGLEFCGSSSGFPCAFPSLEILKLWEMSALEEWNWMHDGDYPQLRSLSISMCFKLIQLPPLNLLRELVFQCCDRLPEIPPLNSLEYLKIDSFQKLEVISLPHYLPALKKLEINNCGRLSSVVGWSQLASGVQFKAHRCPKLNL